MVLELGPCPADDVLRWSKFARRILVELRSNDLAERVVSTDVVDLWSRTLDEWSDEAAGLADDVTFRWSTDLEPEVAEYLLHGLERCLHSPTVRGWIRPEEAREQRMFTMQVVRAFVDGLQAEGRGCQQYADQIMASLGNYIDN